MPDIGTLLDMSAHARGSYGGYSSCHYNCGWNMLTALRAFICSVVSGRSLEALGKMVG
jgi:hypothetical protein